MTSELQAGERHVSDAATCDVNVVGAGFAGLYQLHRLSGSRHGRSCGCVEAGYAGFRMG